MRSVPPVAKITRVPPVAKISSSNSETVIIRLPSVSTRYCQRFMLSAVVLLVVDNIVHGNSCPGGYILAATYPKSLDPPSSYARPCAGSPHLRILRSQVSKLRQRQPNSASPHARVVQYLQSSSRVLVLHASSIIRVSPHCTVLYSRFLWLLSDVRQLSGLDHRPKTVCPKAIRTDYACACETSPLPSTV